MSEGEPKSMFIYAADIHGFTQGKDDLIVPARAEPTSIKDKIGHK